MTPTHTATPLSSRRSSRVTGPGWHAKTPEDVLSAAESHADVGLSADEARARLLRDGPNRLTARAGKSVLRRIVDQFAQPLVVVLIVAAAVSVALDDVVDALVIGAVVLVNAIIGFFQEHRAEQAIAALDALVVTEATVVRDGAKLRVPSHELVVGDVVLLQSGDAVPADLRLLVARDLHVEEAALTGESVPTHKDVALLSEDTVLGDRKNLAFAGTAVTYGTGRGVVVATGDATETGRIAGMIARAKEIATPLTRRIAALSKLLLWIILGISASLFVVGAVRGDDLADTFNAAVALAVGAIPEGLPAAVTVLLAVGVSTMARRGALVRRLPAVETLGSTTVICSDKTGTLTQNEMTVTRVVTVGADYVVTGVGYDPNGGFERDGAPVEPAKEPALAASLRVGALCNDTRLVRVDGATKVEGDPTEAALVVAAEKAHLDVAAWTRLDEVPFESQHMYMATLNDGPGGRVQLVKGSSDVLFARCVDALDASGERVPFDADAMHARVDELAAEGLRVLCLAERAMGASHIGHDDVRELTFVGLVGMIDPPREAAKHAVATSQKAGVMVKMITGDHARTASAIAAQLGLRGALDDQGRLRAVTGRELDALDAAQLSEVAEEVAVFARVAPEQKLRLVEALQARGHVVAMTGDGVNDAPALKTADIGVAMGKGGTDVARGASAMILTDDDFASIEAAVEEGRGVFDNLVKFITWTLPTNGGEALVLLAAVAAGSALPILPVQILWVNMATAVLLGITLVFEPKEPGIMDRPPRDVRAPLLDWSIGVRTILVSTLIAAAAFGVFEYVQSVRPEHLAEARTIAVNTIVVIEVAYLFACRSLRLPIWAVGVFRNRYAWLGATLMLAAQLAFTYVPFMNKLFHTAPIDWRWWLYFTAAGGVVFAVVELKKLLGYAARRAPLQRP